MKNNPQAIFFPLPPRLSKGQADFLTFFFFFDSGLKTVPESESPHYDWFSVFVSVYWVGLLWLQVLAGWSYVVGVFVGLSGAVSLVTRAGSFRALPCVGSVWPPFVVEHWLILTHEWGRWGDWPVGWLAVLNGHHYRGQVVRGLTQQCGIALVWFWGLPGLPCEYVVCGAVWVMLWHFLYIISYRNSVQLVCRCFLVMAVL